MRAAVWIVLLLALAAGTVTLGWWSVPVLGGLWGLYRESPGRAAWEAGVAASLAWAALLTLTVIQGPVWYLAGTLGGIFKIPGPGVLALTLIFPGVLAASAAALAAALRSLVRVQTESTAGSTSDS